MYDKMKAEAEEKGKSITPRELHFNRPAMGGRGRGGDRPRGYSRGGMRDDGRNSRGGMRNGREERRDGRDDRGDNRSTRGGRGGDRRGSDRP